MPGPKLGQLRPSTTCEIEHIEKEDDRPVLLERLCEREFVAARGWQLELRRLVPDCKHEQECIRSYLSSTYQPERVAPITR